MTQDAELIKLLRAFEHPMYQYAADRIEALRAALESAPLYGTIVTCGSDGAAYSHTHRLYVAWFSTTRAEALKGESQ